MFAGPRTGPGGSAVAQDHQRAVQRAAHWARRAPGDPVLRLGVPGWPCACQLVVAAAWEACASWIAARAAAATVEVAGQELIEAPHPSSGQTIVDPAREELAVALERLPRIMRTTGSWRPVS